MDRALLQTVLRWVPWAVAAVAVFVTVTGLRGQIATQHELNTAMQGVKRNVTLARELTGETAAALAPLATTADTLEAMNKGLATTIDDLGVMNDTMARVLVKQEAIAARLDSLNGNMGKVVASLGTVDETNQALLAANRALTAQTNGQAASVGALSSLTGDAIQYMDRLNQKFGFLSKF
ncbi:MAG TPA: hypothetical protein VD902_20675 [Symbiobacteriaceae bacterium]|nr:hypothetical protein [Symbiobacteriaceae bacterium]